MNNDHAEQLLRFLFGKKKIKNCKKVRKSCVVGISIIEVKKKILKINFI